MQQDAQTKPTMSGHAPSPCSAVPLVLDPDYARFIVKARIVCKQDGYALAIHGSMLRDLDLIAVPWTKEARPPIELACRIEFTTGWLRQKADGARESLGEIVKPTLREHGRLVWTFLTPEAGTDSPDWADPRYVDFSVIPPNDKLCNAKERQ